MASVAGVIHLRAYNFNSDSNIPANLFTARDRLIYIQLIITGKLLTDYDLREEAMRQNENKVYIARKQIYIYITIY